MDILVRHVIVLNLAGNGLASEYQAVRIESCIMDACLVISVNMSVSECA